MKVRQVFSAYSRDEERSGDRVLHCLLCGTHLEKTYDLTHLRRQCPECGWTFYNNPLPGVVVLILDEEQVLLGRRAPGIHGAGKWCLPGGYIEHNEDF